MKVLLLAPILFALGNLLYPAYIVNVTPHNRVLVVMAVLALGAAICWPLKARIRYSATEEEVWRNSLAFYGVMGSSSWLAAGAMLQVHLHAANSGALGVIIVLGLTGLGVDGVIMWATRWRRLKAEQARNRPEEFAPELDDLDEAHNPRGTADLHELFTTVEDERRNTRGTHAK
jgi:hypothetical protein